MPPLTLLLLSGGGHTGSNVMATLAPRRAGLRLVASTDTAAEPALFAFDAVYLAPRIADDATGFERRFLEIMARESPDLVIPCRDEDVGWLAELGERRVDLRPRFLCGSDVMARMVNDKWMSYEFCVAHQLPFAPSLPCIDSDAARHDVAAFVEAQGLPLVAKPRHGVDSQDIVILTSLAQARRAMTLPDFVLQRYLGDPAEVQEYLASVEKAGIPLFHTFQGVKRSLQILIGPDGTVDAMVCTRNRMTARNARAIEMDDDPQALAIARQCAQVFAAAGWRGPLNVQCQPDQDGTLLIHEFNARFTGATCARWHLGIDEIGNALRAFGLREIAPAFPVDAFSRDALEGLAARAADPRRVAALAAAGEWFASRT